MMNVRRPSPLGGAVLAYNSGMGPFEKELCWNNGHSMNIMWELFNLIILRELNLSILVSLQSFWPASPN